MSFRLKIKYYLIHALNYTNKTATELISSGKLTVNGNTIFTNEILQAGDELCREGIVIKEKAVFKYYALYKPAGIESTFHPEIEDNLSKVFPFDSRFFVAGRLDKASEGLLIISDDGKWVNSITRADAFKEKEYSVEVESPINDDFIKKVSDGIDIGFYVTRPCKAWPINTYSFGIILTEGKNKQIRRMCKKLGNRVKRLVRTRIDEIYSSDLKPLEYKTIMLT